MISPLCPAQPNLRAKATYSDFNDRITTALSDSACPVTLPPLVTAQNSGRAPGSTATSSPSKSTPSCRNTSHFSNATSGQKSGSAGLAQIATSCPPPPFIGLRAPDEQPHA